jgi:dTDP-4-dehydrorhamnose 3,5-epimerase
MKFIKSDIPDVLICIPKVFEDSRGYLSESFRKDLFEEAVSRKINFCQDITSKSAKGVFRGLHFQTPPYAQSKLVRVIKGKVIDIAVDLRKYSPTYKKHISVELSEYNHKQLFIPRGFAHGFFSIEESIFTYKVDNFYNEKHDTGISVFDPALGIDLSILNKIQVSEKDSSLPKLSEVSNNFNNKEGLYE